MTTESEISAASEKFYGALNRMINGDAGPMREVWSHDDTVSTMHPIGGREVGWEPVRKSWEQVAQIAGGGQVKLSEQVIQVMGDCACELGVEQANFNLAGKQISEQWRVTNIYRREAGAWHIVHHHSDTVQPMIDVIGRLKK